MKKLLVILPILCALVWGQSRINGGQTITGGSTQTNIPSSTPPPPPLTLNNTTPLSPICVVNLSCTISLSATGGVPGYTFTAPGGWLPSGMAVSGATITGTPTIIGTYTGTITVTDTVPTSNTGVSPYSLQVISVAGSSAHNEYCTPSGTWIGPTTDGPANLPTSCFYTNTLATPSPGPIIGPINANQLGATYSTAACGSTILVNAGTSFTGTVSLAGKGCDDAHWITIRGTGYSDPNFPLEGTRANPCIAAITSLPNRPIYPCSVVGTLVPTFIAPSANNAFALNGTDHVRLEALEITRVTTPGAQINNLIDMTSTGATQTNKIILDRVWLHGVNQDGHFPQTGATDTSTTRAIYLGQSNHIALIDSYCSDFYDNSSTSANGNTDAQCLAGGIGAVTNSGWGTYKIVNNQLEGSAESILLGGGNGPAQTPVGCTFGVNCNIDVPSDVEIRLNDMWKSNAWNGNTTVLASTGWPVVKNGFEIKSGNRVFAEANWIENCWYSSQPYCYVFDVAPKNQSNRPNTPIVGTCPTCLTQDITIRYQYGYNYPGHQIAMYTTADAGCSTCTTLGRRISIHDNLVGDNLNKGAVTGLGGYDCLEIEATAGPITNASIRHNTCVNSPSVLMIFGATAIGQLDQITFQDNLTAEGTVGVQASSNAGSGCDGGGTGHPNYDSSNNFLGILNACVNGTTNTWTADHNFTWGSSPITNWPAGNTLLAGAANVLFSVTPPTNSNGFLDSTRNISNYALQSGSPGHNASSDGINVGADIIGLNSKLVGVRGGGSGFAPGNLAIYPANPTVETTTLVPFTCDSNGNGTGPGGNTACNWSLVSGVGSINASGIYTAPSTGGSAVIQAINGSNALTTAITVAGSTPAPSGDCATGYTHRGLATFNSCTMTHQENGGTITRHWLTVIPSNYVAGQSGLIVWVGGGGHGVTASQNGQPCGLPGSEVEGIAPYIHSVPSPAPVVVCPEAMWRDNSHESWNWVGRTLSAAWLTSQFGTATAITPNDPDFIRQLILITVRDLQLNPKKVYMGGDWPSGHWASMMAAQAAGANADLVAALGSNNDSIFNNLDATFTMAGLVGPYNGQKLNNPIGPISVVLTPGITSAATSSFEDMCGDNLPTSSNFYHPLTIDDTMNYWDTPNRSNTHAYQATSGSPTSFCLGTFDGSNNGLPSTLMTRKDTGGVAATEVFAYRFKGNAVPSAWGSFDWNGNDTLGSSGDRRIALDLRVLSPCDFTHPCNQFLDTGTGPASASGYDPLSILYKFFLNHPKP